MEIEFLEFKLGGQSFGVELTLVEELSNASEVTEVPNSHPSIEGIYARRGSTIAVVNLRNCLGKDSEYPAGGEFVVSQVNNSEVALHVDSVAGIHKVDEEEISKPKAIDDNGITKGVVKVGQNLIAILNIEKIMSEITGIFDIS